MRQRLPPGPIGTSCLTCKHRRKKCDQGRPACERCIKGGHKCLGYSHIQRRTEATDVGLSSIHVQFVEERTSAQFCPIESVGLGNGGDDTSIGQGPDQPPEVYSNLMAPEISTYGFIASSLDAHGLGPSFDGPADVARATSIGNSQLLLLPTNNQSWELARSSSSALTLSEFGSWSIPGLAHEPDYLISSIEPRIARTLSTLSPYVRQTITFVLSQQERLLDIVYFTPKRQQIVHFRGIVSNRLQTSSITRCTVFLGAKIVQSLLDRTDPDHCSNLSKSVEQIEQKFLLVASQTSTAAAPNDIEHHLNGFLEVALLKIIMTNGLLAYQLLRKAAPTFLAIAYSDPTLWPNPCGPPAASLVHVISSARHELGHFALVDIACAMAYGLPQIVEYDTSAPVIDNNNLHPIQHIQACPPELQICLADINMRCSRGYISHDWHLVERRLLSYQPCMAHMEDAESWKVVAQLAVAESWRQVLLIYLYMAVCGVASDDPRVQSAVQQIFQLFKAVPGQDPPRVHAHFMFQYLIAGACTRSEKQRAYVRERLLDPYERKLWVLPGSEFVPLDHLWHGAAANGRACQWSDYIFSRQTALPVPICL